MKFNEKIIVMNQPDFSENYIPDQFSNQIFFRDTEYAKPMMYQTISTIKFILSGINCFEFNGSVQEVSSKGLLVINEGEEVTDFSTCKTKALSVFLVSELLLDVHRNLAASTESLLDLPFENGKFNFYDRELKENMSLKELLQKLYQQFASSSFDSVITADTYYLIAGALLNDQKNIQQQINQLKHLRTTSRKELYRRLSIAKAFLEASVENNINLEEICRTSTLSKYHLIRSFKRVYGLTPHRYFMKLKNNKARQILEMTDIPLVEICNKMGYADISTFCKQFKKITNITPTQFRIAIKQSRLDSSIT